MECSKNDGKINRTTDKRNRAILVLSEFQKMEHQTTDSMIENNKSSPIKWHRIKLQNASIRELSKSSDLKGFCQAAGHLVLLLITGSLAWYSSLYWSIWATLGIVFCHGTIFAFLLAGFHELVHGTVFKSKKLNTYFTNIYSFLDWENPVYFWASHTAHHKFTLHPPDDLEIVLPIRLNLKSFILNSIIAPSDFFNRLKKFIRLSAGRLEGEWENKLFPESEPKKRAHYFKWSRIILLGHLGIVIASILLEWWMLPILTTFAPFYGGWLLYLCAQPQHAGLQDQVPDFRCCCRSFHLNPFLQFLYWHMNYHTEHHMYASVPCYHLKKLHQAIGYEMPTLHRGLIPTWFEIITILKKQKQEPTFQFSPLLPGSDESQASTP